jgi:hypothetical protein
MIAWTIYIALSVVVTVLFAGTIIIMQDDDMDLTLPAPVLRDDPEGLPMTPRMAKRIVSQGRPPWFEIWDSRGVLQYTGCSL